MNPTDRRARPPRPSGRPAPKVRPERSGTVKVELISIGRELLRGRIADRNSHNVARFLTLRGVRIPRITTVDDNERAIVADTRLLLITYCLINYWTFDEVIERYDISPTDGLKYLRQLDRMKVIELQPGDRVRLLIANNFSWRKNGAIEKFFRSDVQSEFFSHHFQDDESIRIVKNGMLTRASQLQLIERLKAMGELFDDTTWDERKLSATERHGTTMVLAIRHWFFEGFRHLER